MSLGEAGTTEAAAEREVGIVQHAEEDISDRHEPIG